MALFVYVLYENIMIINSEIDTIKQASLSTALTPAIDFSKIDSALVERASLLQDTQSKKITAIPATFRKFLRKATERTTGRQAQQSIFEAFTLKGILPGKKRLVILEYNGGKSDVFQTGDTILDWRVSTISKSGVVLKHVKYKKTLSLTAD